MMCHWQWRWRESRARAESARSDSAFGCKPAQGHWHCGVHCHLAFSRRHEARSLCLVNSFQRGQTQLELVMDLRVAAVSTEGDQPNDTYDASTLHTHTEQLKEKEKTNAYMGRLNGIAHQLSVLAVNA